MTISKDRVKPSPLPDSWKLAEIFTTGVVLGSYLAMMTVIFFWAAYKTDFFPVHSSESVVLVRKPLCLWKKQALINLEVPHAGSGIIWNPSLFFEYNLFDTSI